MHGSQAALMPNGVRRNGDRLGDRPTFRFDVAAHDQAPGRGSALPYSACGTFRATVITACMQNAGTLGHSQVITNLIMSCLSSL